ncbi:uncharacterized protein ALTATR162_LOCUS3820 [Alternaria atra]|uniref:Uncharacterized protein n=1 Tax=Alternaria atra TaxID=119953 RepID=A0A8J2I331_9PLEO|nr:uncharacterized protein ALTATR162_LOCUS3820 [Alternaria atra]CAG5155757.1 unnamed protein product [Alternaria atra]
MSPSVSLQKGDVSYAEAAKDAQIPKVSFPDQFGESRTSPSTSTLQRPDGSPYNTRVSQTPDYGRIWTLLVHISGDSKEHGQRTVCKYPTIRPNAAMFHSSSHATEGLNDGANGPSNPFHCTLQPNTESPSSYASLHDTGEDGKTLECNRTLTFDTFVEAAQLGDNNPSETAKRRHRDRFRSWMKARVEELHLMRKSR